MKRYNENLVCPFDKEQLLIESEVLYCTSDSCIHSSAPYGYQLVNGIPILISEEQCDTVCWSKKINSYVPRKKNKLHTLLRAALIPRSETTVDNCWQFIEKIKSKFREPNILVIGSGNRGSGTEQLWSDNTLNITGTDIYISDSVDIVSDAHYLPFPNESFDGVWIQAVLEHVVEPHLVVSEIFRILKVGGVVYAETPFMQQVHEGAYDFNRYTVLGHRYLFKNFKAICFGGNKGAEIALAWSIKYFLWALFRSKALSSLFGIFFQVLLRPIKSLLSKKALFDSSSGVFFMGEKIDGQNLTHKALVEEYRGMF